MNCIWASIVSGTPLFRANLEIPGTFHRVLRQGSAAEQYDGNGGDSTAQYRAGALVCCSRHR
jgi:hypothetical protein